jgi:hypothetical protein
VIVASVALVVVTSEAKWAKQLDANKILIWGRVGESDKASLGDRGAPET